MGSETEDPSLFQFVEVYPIGRYGRYNEILGKGASKTVYRAFDEYEGIEVAWNQVKYDFLQSPENLERLYCEIQLLKTMKHMNIMKFDTSWVDTAERNINFVIEVFISGTLSLSGGYDMEEETARAYVLMQRASPLCFNVWAKFKVGELSRRARRNEEHDQARVCCTLKKVASGGIGSGIGNNVGGDSNINGVKNYVGDNNVAAQITILT